MGRCVAGPAAAYLAQRIMCVKVKRWRELSAPLESTANRAAQWDDHAAGSQISSPTSLIPIRRPARTCEALASLRWRGPGNGLC
jgi:hypothetical protein